jgi:hypothetical protein
MVAIANPPAPIPDLPAYNPDQSLSLGDACRLGFVPGHDGRRAAPAEAAGWSHVGFPVRPFGPRYLFPAVLVNGALRTNVPWCGAWVGFIAEAQANDRPRKPERADKWGAAA